jgi:hypothetical protein
LESGGELRVCGELTERIDQLTRSSCGGGIVELGDSGMGEGLREIYSL